MSARQPGEIARHSLAIGGKFSAKSLPEFAFRLVLDPMRGAPHGVSVPHVLPYFALTAYALCASAVAWLIFLRQDEPTIS